MDTSVEIDEIKDKESEPLIEETEMETFPELEDQNFEEEEAEEFEVSQEQCETLYGVVLETAHGIIGTKGGKPHRDLPESRRKAQGKLLFHICQKYNIQIPSEFEIVIFGGALFADWQYMGAKGENDDETITTETNNDS